MQKFIAKNATQLDKCLKFLFSKQVEFKVEVLETEKGKINYSVSVDVEDDVYNELNEMYQILIK